MPPRRGIPMNEDLLKREKIGGRIIARKVSADEFMEEYAAHHCEWIDGNVIFLPIVRMSGEDCKWYVKSLLRAYLHEVGNKEAMITGAAYVMRLSDRAILEPDIQVVLDETRVTETFTDGAADICIEIASKERRERAYGVKRAEYERGGVKEYWLIDLVDKQPHFFRLNQDGIYVEQAAENTYTTPLLPRFRLHIATLFRQTPPELLETMQMAEAMLKE